MIIEPQYDTADSFSDGLAIVGYKVESIESDPNGLEK